MTERQVKLGRFQCCACNAEFQLRPGVHDDAHCPVCGSLYYEWLDYVKKFRIAGADGAPS